MGATLVIHVITRITTHLLTPEEWKAELAWHDMEYNDACIVLRLPSLHERRHELSERLFHQLTACTVYNRICVTLPLLTDVGLPSNSH